VSTFSKIRESVVGLSKPERAELAVLLLGSLDDTHYWIDDEEVDNRSAEMDSGAVVGVTKEEFRGLCGR
jgi:Putative addiction module component